MCRESISVGIFRIGGGGAEIDAIDGSNPIAFDYPGGFGWSLWRYCFDKNAEGITLGASSTELQTERGTFGHRRIHLEKSSTQQRISRRATKHTTFHASVRVVGTGRVRF